MGSIENNGVVQVSELIPYVNNAKVHTEEQVTKIASSIREFGFLNPVLIDKDKNIIAGHGRVMAAKKLGLETVPVLFIEGLTDAQRKAYILADNRLGELAGWDQELVNAELAQLLEQDFDIDLTGFELPDDYFEEEKTIEEDEAPEPPKEPKTKHGDVYQLGRHRLICGDSTDVATIERLLDGGRAELLLTDPPYGINVVNVDKIGAGKPVTIKGCLLRTTFTKAGENKIVDCNEYAPVIGDDTTETAQESYDVAIMYTDNQIIFGGNYFTDFLPASRCWLVWDKENTGNFADAELAWTSFKNGVKLYHFMWNGLCREGKREVEGRTRVHPTQKPVGMLAKILQDFSKEGDHILDLFGGSGSTLIACEQLNRTCYMCELSEAYCDVIVERWEKLTGEKAVLL